MDKVGRLTLDAVNVQVHVDCNAVISSIKVQRSFWRCTGGKTLAARKGSNVWDSDRIHARLYSRHRLLDMTGYERGSIARQAGQRLPWKWTEAC